MTDRVTGDQTDYVGRTSAYHATPTTNCCGCPEDVFVVRRFACPSISLLVALCFLVLLFVLPATSPGGHETSLFILFHFIFFLIFQLFLCPFRFAPVSYTHLTLPTICSV